MTKPAASPLRERTRRAVRGELMDVGMALFARQGYDATTVEEVAQAAGMSKRSFFRYFDSKEDLVLGNQESIGEEVAQALAGRPADEPPWPALRRAFDLVVERMDSAPDRALILLRMLNDTPGLMASQLARRSRWRELLVPHLHARLTPEGASPHDPRPLALAGAALACYEATQATWLASGGTLSVGLLLDDAMSAVAPLET
ncbi:helix-turn-helix domain-containing protein [Spirillospora sp. NPDC048819]|uniref:TetR/AcrR family transcriptional regulator n=1 Tax=Spirillospora sp. NPDC048819 TaxID=3155268 RepID=UPI0034052F89